MRGEEVWPAPVGVTGGGIYPRAEDRLCDALGLSRRDHEGVKRALGAVDRWAAPTYAGPPLDEPPVPYEAVFPHTRVARSIWGTWDGVESYGEEFLHPLADVDTVAEVDAHPWPSPDLFDYRALHWFTDPDGVVYSPEEFGSRRAGFARFIGGWSPVFSRITDLCGMEAGLMRMADRPDLVEAMTVHIGDFLEGYYRALAEACRGHADVVVFGDDFAAQSGLLMRPDRWEQYFLPTWRRLFDVAHQNGMLALLHSCGAVRPVLPGLVDAGLDILEVVQVQARGMDPVELKSEFGSHLAFYGGVDVQEILPRGTPAEVRAEARRLRETLGRGGRYVLAPSHFIMDDVPPENVLALYEEAGGLQRPDPQAS
jgi:uroporphyrinogen decarboxylase